MSAYRLVLLCLSLVTLLDTFSRVSSGSVDDKLKTNGGSRNGRLVAIPPVKPQPGLYQQQQQHRIAGSQECRADVERLCGPSIAQSNFSVMDCLENEPNEVTLECQHFLWQYKRNLTTDIRFESASWEVCKDDLQKMEECQNLRKGKGLIIPCLMENQHNISGQHCRQFLVKMESIVFSDFRLLKPLLDSCHKDIVDTKCGRIGSLSREEEEVQLHSHGAVIGCLEDNIKKLNSSCRFQMMRIAELQADDYHLDRPLFYACRDDRERLCPETPSGGGRIYQCLFRHKFERDMTDECRQRLIIRQRLIGENYKADKTLSDACDDDIKQYKCLGGGPNLMFAKRSAILLCLEGVQKTGGRVSGKCTAKMAEWRRILMADYQISAEIVVDCQEEIKALCGGLGAGGKTLHCLMGKAGQKPGDIHEHQLGNVCMRAIEDLLKVADVAEDVGVDQVLMEACSESLAKYCANIPNGDGRVMSCLMKRLENILDSDDNCAKPLLEIQYFVARDFRLDHRVYKHCHKDAARLCGASDKWVVQGSTDVDPGPLVLPCLYRHIVHHDEVERGCRGEVKRVMRTRAMSISLMPEIEERCIQDLAQFCSEGTGQGEEVRCLQDKYDDLTPDCQEAINNFTEAEDADINLDVILMRACMPMIKMFCQDMLDGEYEEDIMECLIENKNRNDMNSKCAAGIEHHQLMSLKEFRFNHKFKENCKSSVLTFCKNKKSKYDVVSCLSEIVRNDTLFEEKHRIVKPCRRQLRVELLQRAENIELDPDLKKACEADKRNFCDNVTPGRAQVIECLKKHQKKLSRSCKKLLFVREVDEVEKGADYVLMNNCKKMIKIYCSHERPHQILDCLKQHQTEEGFDQRCHRTVIERQITQNKDYRLNPQLKQACTQDVPKFCRNVLSKARSDDLMEGKVIACLKKQFKINRLSLKCEGYIREVMHDAALDYRQDPVLAEACKDMIKKLCGEALEYPPGNKENEAVPDEKGGVEECLKKQLKQNRITEESCVREVSRVIAEGQTDIHLDPLLHSVCVSDIRHHCSDVVPGQGQMILCLVSLLEDKVRLSPACKEKLLQRKEMWEILQRVGPEIILQHRDRYVSHARGIYLHGLLVVIIVVVFVMSIYCCRKMKKTLKYPTLITDIN